MRCASCELSLDVGQIEELGNRAGGTSPLVGICSSRQEAVDDIGGVAEYRRAQRRLTVVVGTLNVSAMVEQQINHLGVAVVGGKDEQRISPLIGQIHRHTQLEQLRKPGSIAVTGVIETTAEQLHRLVVIGHLSTVAGCASLGEIGRLTPTSVGPPSPSAAWVAVGRQYGAPAAQPCCSCSIDSCPTPPSVPTWPH